VDIRNLIVFAHGGSASLIDHEDLMFLFPLLPAMLVGTIVVAQVLQKRGLFGAADRTVAMSATLAAVAATLSLGAAAIHFAVIKEHLEFDLGFGLFFIALGWFQVVWAQLYLLRPSALLARVAAAANLVVIGVWVVSRTTGLPFGPQPWVPEAVGTLDVFASAFELALVAVLLPQVAPRRWPSMANQRIAFERAFVLAAFTVLMVTTLATIALIGTPGAEVALAP
jgi:hypothetical protein